MERKEEENNEIKVIIKYSSYTPAQKKAIKKYREENREKINQLHKDYYYKQKETNPDFLQKKRDQAKQYYLKKKTLKNQDKNI